MLADTLSAHKTPRVDAVLTQYPRVQRHVTPTDSSWLNPVARWFAKIERDGIARGVCPSVPDLNRTRMRESRHSNTPPAPVTWTYFDAARRITPESIVTVH